jgi:hypothetical protein
LAPPSTMMKTMPLAISSTFIQVILRTKHIQVLCFEK